MPAGLQMSRGSANPGTSSPRLSPDGKVHHVIDLVPPNKAAEGEALELDNEDVGQPPQHQLLGSLTVLFALGAVPGGRQFSLLAWGEPQSLQPSSAPGSPHRELTGYVGVLSSFCQGQASTVLQSTSFAPYWLSPSQCTGKASPSFLAASRNSVQVQAAPGKPLLPVWPRWLEPTLRPSSPRFLWGQDFRLREEIEALLQGEVASSGCFAG